MDCKDFTIICGHYGCGKTNLSINLALEAAAMGRRVTLVDFDVVNPYFRSSEYASMLAGRGVRVIAPVYARTGADLPMIAAEVFSIFSGDGTVFVDVGGDGAGAAVLGRFSDKILCVDYDMLYVINQRRALSSTAEEAVALLGEIEGACRLRATGIVNNTHLMDETTPEVIAGAFGFAEAAARITGLPLRGTAVPRLLMGALDRETAETRGIFPVDVHVRPPWDSGGDEREAERRGVTPA